MRRAFSTTISTGSGSATAGLSPPAIMSRKSKDRGPSCPVTFRSTASRPTSSAAPSPTAPAGAGGSTQTGTCVLYFTRAEIEDGALAGKGLEVAWAADPVELFFVEIQGSGRIRLPDGSVMRIGYAGQNGRDYVAIGRHAARPRDPSSGRRQHAGDQGLDPRQSRRGQGADARELVLHLLPGADRAGAARLAGRRDHAARRRLPPIPISFRWARRSSSRWTVARPTACGSRRTWAARSRDPTASTPSGARDAEATATRRRNVGLGPGADPVAQGRGGEGRRPCVRSALKRRELWAEVAATIRPLSRERLNPPRNGEADQPRAEGEGWWRAHGRAASTAGRLHRPLRGRFPSPSRGGIPSMVAGTSDSAQARRVPTGCSICTE